MPIQPSMATSRFRHAVPAALVALGCSLPLLLASHGPALAKAHGTLTISKALQSDATSDEVADEDNSLEDITTHRNLTLKPGDTLNGLLTRESIAEDERAAALKALGELYDIDEIKPGDRVELSLRTSLDPDAPTHLLALQLHPAYKGDFGIVAGADGAFHRFGKPAPSVHARAPSMSLGITTRKGKVTSDLAHALAKADLPQSVADDVMLAFAGDPKTPTNPEPGSRFTVVYETTKSGTSHSTGHTTAVMRYADLISHGQKNRVYRYETNDGRVAFMEESGRGVEPFALGAPIRNAEISSPYGWRMHPVLKVRKFHNGIDFRAPAGTPIYAAAAGIIDEIGWHGNYGRFIKLTHSDHIATTYGHMSGFAKGLHAGSRVKKGQLIAYVGRSGLATGNHLYFEVMVDDKYVDPAQPEFMLEVNLDGSSLVRFRTYVARVSENESVTRPRN
jgi:murein DD-endopeptidase MepM/ murein hydrolase activator NlpD